MTRRLRPTSELRQIWQEELDAILRENGRYKRDAETLRLIVKHRMHVSYGYYGWKAWIVDNAKSGRSIHTAVRRAAKEAKP